MMYPNENCGCFGPIVPPTYPYMGSKQCMCDCCNYMHQPTSYNKYPASGPMQENAFMIINATPYLIDNYNIPASMLIAVGKGAHEPYIRGAKTEGEHAMNRRVEIRLVYKESVPIFMRQRRRQNCDE